MIGTLLWAYKGHTAGEKWASNGAAFAAIITAIVPTRCDLCEAGIQYGIHCVAAVILFGTIAYFCLGPFRRTTKGQKGRKGRRATVYFVCGWIIVAGMLGASIAEFERLLTAAKAPGITYLAELIASWAFAVAWIVASKVIPGLVDKDERLGLSWKGRGTCADPDRPL
jgi:quinol-cytochrome oxidoreductase complex cytochrome b subunit